MSHLKKEGIWLYQVVSRMSNQVISEMLEIVEV